jgi:hypothetical protein
MKDAFKHYGSENKATLDLLEELSDKLSRIIELLEGQGTIRPG